MARVLLLDTLGLVRLRLVGLTLVGLRLLVRDRIGDHVDLGELRAIASQADDDEDAQPSKEEREEDASGGPSLVLADGVAQR